MRLTMAAIIGMVGSSIVANAAFAAPIVGFGSPTDVIFGGTVIDFEALASDTMPVTDSNTSTLDPRVGARNALNLGSGLTVVGLDTSTSAGTRSGSLFVADTFVLTEADGSGAFNLYPYTGVEDFNTDGQFLMNWDKTDYDNETFIDAHTNQFVFSLDTAVDQFAFNFGANDNIWKLEAFDEFDVLLETLDIAAHQTRQASEGQYYGIATSGIRKLVLTDTFVSDNGDGTFTSCNTSFSSKCGEWVVLDNVAFGTAVSVIPVPAALPLLLGALGLFGVIARRRT